MSRPLSAAPHGLTRQQRWYRSHLETARERSRLHTKEWRKAHPQESTASNRVSYRRHIDKRRAEARVAARIRRARMRGDPETLLLDRLRKQERRASGKITAAEWAGVVARWGGRCAYCKEQTTKPEIDHVIPLARGGTHTIDNVVPACKPCNSSKKHRLLSEWGGRV